MDSKTVEYGGLGDVDTQENRLILWTEKQSNTEALERPEMNREIFKKIK